MSAKSFRSMQNEDIPTTLNIIGQTPLIRLSTLSSSSITLCAKAEFMNPGGSIKDRAALAILHGARREGRLLPGQAVVEMTSGNMGAGLAVVCNVLGHPFTAVMSEGNSRNRAQMLKDLGAEVVLVPQVDGDEGQVTGSDIEAAVDRAQTIADERDAYYVDQFANPGSLRAHEEGTGPEIWSALGDRLGAFVAAVGSGGTFVGTSRYLKKKRPDLICAAVEPDGTEVLAGKEIRKVRHVIQGTGYGKIPPHWEPELADVYLSVTDEEAMEYRRRLAKDEGLYVGYSAATNVCAAIKLINGDYLEGEVVVATVLCDTGLKY